MKNYDYIKAEADLFVSSSTPEVEPDIIIRKDTLLYKLFKEAKKLIFTPQGAFRGPLKRYQIIRIWRLAKIAWWLIEEVIGVLKDNRDAKRQR